MSFRNSTLYENGTFIYSLSQDNGYTWIGNQAGVGSYAFLVRPIGMYQDEESGRILLAGTTYYRDPNGGANDYSKCETSFMYIEDVDKAKFDFELESAYGFEYGLAAPVAFRLNTNKATFLGAQSDVTLDLKDGWNHFEFTLDMPNETPAASLSVNGGAEINVPVDAEIGNYTSFIHIRGLGELTYYLDEFLVIDEDNSFVPDIIVSAESISLTELPEALSKNYDDFATFTAAMQGFVLADADETYLAENTALYSLSPIISKDGGDTWAETTAYEIPLDGITVKIAYPEGTAANTHAFRALALVTDDGRKTDDYGKMLTVTEGEDGLYIKTSTNAPVILSWAEFVDPITEEPGVSLGGDSTILWAGIGAGVLAIAAAAVFIAVKSKKKPA